MDSTSLRPIGHYILFIDWEGSDANEIGDSLSKVTGGNLELKMITNRGVKVYPNGMPETYCTDHWY